MATFTNRSRYLVQVPRRLAAWVAAFMVLLEFHTMPT